MSEPDGTVGLSQEFAREPLTTTSSSALSLTFASQSPVTALVWAWVLVHAHPDDETLWTGALLATLAAAGERVVVITCTRGERGEVITAPGTATEFLGHLTDDAVALAHYRAQELQAALAALGPSIEHHFLDELPLPAGVVATSNHYQDSGMVWIIPPTETGNGTSTGGVAGSDPAASGGFAQVPVDEPAARLARFGEQVAARPGSGDRIVMVTYEQDGGYGHPDHVQAHRVAVRACELLAERTMLKPELWEVTKPGEPADWAVPVAPVLPQLLAALRAYPSQVQNVTADAQSENQKQGNSGQTNSSQANSSQAISILGAPPQLGTFALSGGVPIPIRPTENYRICQAEVNPANPVI